jgi:HD-GYP domain-containing protein (c-di-GMP phosphodiesterase class II)
LAHDEYTNSCLNTRAIIEYTRRRFPGRLGELLIGLPAPFATMDSPELFLSDENNWVPSTVVVKMFENVRRITGNASVAFDIGYESIIRREFGYFQKLFLTFFSSPRGILRIMNRLNTKLNTTKTIEIMQNTIPGQAVFRWHWRPGIIVSKDICEYNKGIYSAVPTLWGLPPARVEESTCHFETGGFCENTIRWSLSRGRFRNLVSRLFTRKSDILRAFEEVEGDKEKLKQANIELHQANEDLTQKVAMLKAVNTATQTIVDTSDLTKIYEETMKPIVEVLGFDRALLMLKDEKSEALEFCYGVGESQDALRKLLDYRPSLDRRQNLMIRVMEKKKPFLIRDVASSGLNPTNRILADFHVSAFVICPLVVEDRAIGILGADRKEGRPRLTSRDMEFLYIFTNSIATALQRARMDAALKDQAQQLRVRADEIRKNYVSTMLALVKAIEEKDTYTKGHSQRVAENARIVAVELGMPEPEIELLYFGSILHDVGKIGISESIVKSPKRLTEAERRIIQQHPAKGAEILKPIAYIRNHMYLVRNHHERWDGKGYPDGLKEEEIPLGAQIVAVVDTWDAMTSSRSYRREMPRARAIREIEANMGTQFSPRAAGAFLKAIEEGKVPADSSSGSGSGSSAAVTGGSNGNGSGNGNGSPGSSADGGPEGPARGNWFEERLRDELLK